MKEASQPESAHVLAGTQESFGWLLRRYRLAAGLTQEELAERAGVSVKGLSLLESGKRQTPYRHTVTVLARALSLTVGETATLEAAVVRVRTPASSDVAMAREEDLPPDAIPLTLLLAPPTPRSNLPVQPTSFIGRKREQAEVMALLGRAPLLTLTGSGGVGKTRLALAVAGDLVHQYPDGVWLVELAALAEPSLVPGEVAQVLGVREEAGRPLIATITDHIKEKHLLLVLDNCEHLVAACAALVSALLRACPRLRVLATSREALDVAGEHRYRVPSLPVPDLTHLPSPERLSDAAAVALFVVRAQERRADFALTAQNARAVASVCTRLDGMPLAIELAAARVGSLPVEAIAARLDDRFKLLTGGARDALPRQQTLRAALDWSYDLLSEREQHLLDRLSVRGIRTQPLQLSVIRSGSWLETKTRTNFTWSLCGSLRLACDSREERNRVRPAVRDLFQHRPSLLNLLAHIRYDLPAQGFIEPPGVGIRLYDTDEKRPHPVLDEAPHHSLDQAAPHPLPLVRGQHHQHLHLPCVAGVPRPLRTPHSHADDLPRLGLGDEEALLAPGRFTHPVQGACPVARGLFIREREQTPLGYEGAEGATGALDQHAGHGGGILLPRFTNSHCRLDSYWAPAGATMYGVFP
jgi:transcriptional regulator with XRE-family HTH domain